MAVPLNCFATGLCSLLYYLHTHFAHIMSVFCLSLMLFLAIASIHIRSMLTGNISFFRTHVCLTKSTFAAAAASTVSMCSNTWVMYVYTIYSLWVFNIHTHTQIYRNGFSFWVLYCHTETHFTALLYEIEPFLCKQCIGFYVGPFTSYVLYSLDWPMHSQRSL